MEDREMIVVPQYRIPLYIREEDIVDRESEHVLALCYYCHDAYVPVPMTEYSQCVVYNCGCHKNELSKDDKGILIGLAIVLAIVITFFGVIIALRL